ncbi:hypothetical protein Q8A73_013384 [Channa argus]|nr:hypothetical protein Q8A73_013384 [Channa argus]
MTSSSDLRPELRPSSNPPTGRIHRPKSTTMEVGGFFGPPPPPPPPPPRPIPPAREPVIHAWLLAVRPERGGGDADRHFIIHQLDFAPAFGAPPAFPFLPPFAPAFAAPLAAPFFPPFAPGFAAPLVFPHFAAAAPAPPVWLFAAPPVVPHFAAPDAAAPAPPVILPVPPFAAPDAAPPPPVGVPFAGHDANVLATPPVPEEPEVPTSPDLSLSTKRSREESDEEESVVKRLRWCNDSDSD